MAETVVAAAIQWQGITISLPKPARHSHILWAALDDLLGKEHVAVSTQGFLTSEGRFVNRIEAKNIAYIAGQIKETPNPTQLFSEDLW